MKEGTYNARIPVLTVSLVLAGLVFLVPGIAGAATMFISPSAGSFHTDQSFTVAVRTNTQGAAINAAEAVLRFDPARLRVESVSGDGSIFNLNVQQPSFSNAAGTITFAGVILNPGYTGASGNLLTVTFRARTAGQTAVSFASGAVLANDGAGTNVLSGMGGATYTIIGGPTPPPVPVPTTGPGTEADPFEPIITSPTHADEDTWYPSNDVVLTWPLPNDASGVSWLIDPKPDGNPGNVLDEFVSEVSFEDLDDGETYFHLKFRRGGQFGPIAHYRLRIDTEPPELFEIVRIREGDPTDPQPWLLFETTDATSGVHQYRMRIGDGAWFDVPEATPERPFQMPLQAPGTREVIVEAIDAAGLAARHQLSVTVASIPVPRITSPADGAVPSTFEVAGRAPADSTVTVRAYRIDWSGHVAPGGATLSVPALSGAAGTWRTVMEGLGAGMYELEAMATDARGATSYPSERVTVTIGSWPVRFGLRAWFWFLALPWVLRWALGVAVAVFLLVLVGWRRRRGVVTVTERGREQDSRIAALIKDVGQELEMLRRLKRSRPLYPEERHLSRKLEAYRRELMKIARTGVLRTRTVRKVRVAKAKAKVTRARVRVPKA